MPPATVIKISKEKAHATSLELQDREALQLEGLSRGAVTVRMESRNVMILRDWRKSAPYKVGHLLR